MKAALSILGLAILAAPAARAEPLQSAQVTAAINHVVLAEPGGASQPADVGDTLHGRSTLETGQKSRAELTFNDKTIARLGANSVFSFSRGSRDLELNRGVILLQVPKGAGGATVQTAAVTAAITGTTVAIEFWPSLEDVKKAIIKIFVLEGTLRAYLKKLLGDSVLLGPGEMIEFEVDASSLPDPQVFDIQRFIETAGLLGDQFSQIPSWELILAAIAEQAKQKRFGRLLLSNFTLNGQMPTGAQNALNSANNIAIRNFAGNTPPSPPQQPAQQPPPPPRPPAPPPPPPPPPQPPPPCEGECYYEGF